MPLFQRQPTLTIGSSAPDFNLKALNGIEIGLWDCLLDGALVIEFIRGTWCPHARQRLVELAKARNQFTAIRVRLLVIVGEDQFTVERYFTRNPSPLTILTDPDRATARAYGVHQRIAIERWNFAKPSSFFIDRAGFIRFVFIARIRTEILPVETLLENIRAIHSEGEENASIR